MFIKIFTKKRLVHDMQMRMFITAFIVMLSFFVGMYSYAYSNNFFQVPDLKYNIVSKSYDSYSKGYEAGLSFARKKLGNIGLTNMYGNQQLNYVNAEVKSIDGHKLIIEIPGVQIDILGDEIVYKTVKVSTNTEIQKQVQKSQDELSNEYEKYSKLLSSSGSDLDSARIEGIEAFSPYIIKNIEFEDLKVGDIVFVESKTDIRKSDSFEAINISLISNS